MRLIGKSDIILTLLKTSNHKRAQLEAITEQLNLPIGKSKGKTFVLKDSPLRSIQCKYNSPTKGGVCY